MPARRSFERASVVRSGRAIMAGTRPPRSVLHPLLLGLLACLLLRSAALSRQAESVAGVPAEPLFVAHGRVEGHLALRYSPAAAFSPDSERLAVIAGDRIALLDLCGGSISKVLSPRFTGVMDLEFESANFLSPTSVLILGRGGVQAKGQSFARRTPLLAFQWDANQDNLLGKVNSVGAGGGFSPILYLPQISSLGMYKDGKITLWNPSNGRGGELTLAELAYRPGLFTFSPDGRWLLLARVEGNATADPMVVDVGAKKFVDVLAGHHASVLGMSFSLDSRRVVTACEDGQVRVWSVPDWKLVQTLSGHAGPVHWADFSPDAKLIASVGEDKTLRVWSAENGRLLQTLEESRAPLLTVAFSPSGNYIAASSEQMVLVWEQR